MPKISELDPAAALTGVEQSAVVQAGETVRAALSGYPISVATQAALDLKQNLDATLTALAALDSTAGLLTQTGADAFVRRTLTGTASEVTVTNGSGAAGNPTLSLPAAMTFTGKTVTGGTFAGPAISGAAITTSTYNGNTWTAGTGVLTIAAAKTAAFSNTLTFTGTDASSVAFGAGGTVAYVADKLSAFAATTSAELKATISDETGSGGALVFATSPTITTPTINQPNIVGTTTNDSAAAGSVGEVLSTNVLFGSAVSLTTATPANVMSRAFTAGEWEVFLELVFSGGATTTCTYIWAALENTSAVMNVLVDTSAQLPLAGVTTPFSAVSPKLIVGPFRLSVSGTTTYYGNAQAAFATSTCAVHGVLRGRRIR